MLAGGPSRDIAGAWRTIITQRYPCREMHIKQLVAGAGSLMDVTCGAGSAAPSVLDGSAGMEGSWRVAPGSAAPSVLEGSADVTTRHGTPAGQHVTRDGTNPSPDAEHQTASIGRCLTTARHGAMPTTCLVSIQRYLGQNMVIAFSFFTLTRKITLS